MMSRASTTTSSRASARMRFPSSRVILAPPSLSYRSASAMPVASLAAAGAMVNRSSGVSMGLQYHGGDADTPPMRYLSLPVTLADADYTATGQVLQVVLPCGLALWVPAGDVDLA